MEILMILRKIAQGDDYSRLYKTASEDALFVEKRLRDLLRESAEQSVHLTAYRRWLWASVCVHIVSGFVLLFSAFGGR
jgi:hypothetical protein